MKCSQEQCIAQKKIHTIQSRVVEVTQWLQLVQDKDYQLFTEVEGQGTELEQVVTTAEKNIEGPINDADIQEFIEQEVAQ
jgi:hypothetical protein